MRITNKEYKLRMRDHYCPICGSPVVSHYGGDECSATRCANCGCYLEYEDYSPVYTLYDAIGCTKSKKKVLGIVNDFQEGATGSHSDMHYMHTLSKRKIRAMLSESWVWHKIVSPKEMAMAIKHLKKSNKKIHRSVNEPIQNEFPF